MTPKQQYDAKKQFKKEQAMARDEDYDARQKKEQVADECVTIVLESITAFFNGKATIKITPLQIGTGQVSANGQSGVFNAVGHEVRFVKDEIK